MVPEFDPMTTNTLKWMEENAGRYQPMYDEAGNSIRGLSWRAATSSAAISPNT